MWKVEEIGCAEARDEKTNTVAKVVQQDKPLGKLKNNNLACPTLRIHLSYIQ